MKDELSKLNNKLKKRFKREGITDQQVSDVYNRKRCEKCLGRIDIKTQRKGMNICKCKTRMVDVEEEVIED
ncbi:MAG: hypothetical protein HYT73_03430 [Candidatus Aenigmarchaeota archaeon]|nr:hypothetical protein [Candidatus Aenigmarchaeota archaeon]